MSKLDLLISAPPVRDITKEIVMTDRIKDTDGNPFTVTIRALTVKEEEACYKDSKRVVPGANGAVQTVAEPTLELCHKVVKGIISHDFNNDELLTAQKVASGVDLLQKLFTPGEIRRVAVEINRLSGYVPVADVFNETKNS